ncbi:MAG TPA: hypothetical protein VE093_49080 [Polyangiaceae bacterium]|nr:hypothetical protein [Polyangiaceae bacterium]
MLHRMKHFALFASALALALSSMACSSLTRPEEISIAAEPLPGRTQPAQGAAPAAPAMPAAAPAAQGG